jgi:hypothetical protein
MPSDIVRRTVDEELRFHVRFRAELAAIGVVRLG